MTNRYRFWIGTACAVSLCMVLAGCMDPAYSPRPAAAQESPSIAKPLTAGATSISPYNPATASAADAVSMAGQKVVKVGLLLPLSGRNAELGRALQDAATVSLFDKYARLSIRQQTVRVELLPKDTGDTPEQASNAMKEAIDEGAAFIIGPLFADATSAAATIAREKNISVLSLSNNRAPAPTGVYMFGFSPQEQAERIVNYALSNGKTRIAVLVPNSPLGETVLASARTALQRTGLKPIVEAKYAAQGAGLDAALNTLVPQGQAPNFDALLLPEGGPALETLMRGLSIRGVKPTTVQFLGTGIWDDTALLRRVNLDGAWFASSSPVSTSQFEQRFTSTYNYAPPRIASLSYDAVALAVTLATSGRPFDTVTLTNAAGYAGPANGIFRLRAGGTVQRGLAVMKVDAGNLTIISPSPTGF